MKKAWIYLQDYYSALALPTSFLSPQVTCSLKNSARPCSLLLFFFFLDRTSLIVNMATQFRQGLSNVLFNIKFLYVYLRLI